MSLSTYLKVLENFELTFLVDRWSRAAGGGAKNCEEATVICLDTLRT